MYLQKLFLYLMLTTVLAFETQGQVSKSFFYPPGLEFALPEDKWERQRQTYDDAMWHPGRHHLRNDSENISIRITCDLFENLEVKPDSMDWLVEERIKFDGSRFKKETINGFTVYLIESREGEAKAYEYIAQATHPWGHFASFSVSIPAARRKEADDKAREIIQKTFMRTPAEVDQAMGLPYPANTNLDSLFEARLEEIRKEAAGQYPEDYLEKELAKLKPEDLIWDAMDGYSWDKRYRIRAQIGRGDFSLDDALNHQFLEKDAPDIAFFQREFRSDGGGLFTGINKVIQRNCFPPIDTSRFDFFFGDQTNFYHLGKTYYWATSFANDSTSCLLLCYWREAGKWKIHSQQIDFPWKVTSLQIMDYLPENEEDPHYSTGELSFPKQHQLNTIRIFETEEGPSRVLEWAFNAMIPNSNVIALPEYVVCEAPFDVTYLISDIHVINGRAQSYQPKEAPNVRDSTDFLTLFAPAFQAQFSLASIRANADLKQQICKDPDLCKYLDGKEPAPSWFDGEDADSTYWQQSIIHVACILQAMKASPAKRQYASTLLFSDLDGNGIEEMMQLKVSNGQLTDYFIYEPTEQGLGPIQKSKAWEERIVQTEFCRAMLRMSSTQENLLARFGE